MADQMLGVLEVLCAEAHGAPSRSLYEGLEQRGLNLIVPVWRMANSLTKRFWRPQVAQDPYEQMAETWGTTPDAVAAQQRLLAKSGAALPPIKR